MENLENNEPFDDENESLSFNTDDEDDDFLCDEYTPTNKAAETIEPIQKVDIDQNKSLIHFRESLQIENQTNKSTIKQINNNSNGENRLSMNKMMDKPQNSSTSLTNQNANEFKINQSNTIKENSGSPIKENSNQSNISFPSLSPSQRQDNMVNISGFNFQDDQPRVNFELPGIPKIGDNASRAINDNSLKSKQPGQVKVTISPKLVNIEKSLPPLNANSQSQPIVTKSQLNHTALPLPNLQSSNNQVGSENLFQNHIPNITRPIISNANGQVLLQSNNNLSNAPEVKLKPPPVPLAPNLENHHVISDKFQDQNNINNSNSNNPQNQVPYNPQIPGQSQIPQQQIISEQPPIPSFPPFQAVPSNPDPSLYQSPQKYPLPMPNFLSPSQPNTLSSIDKVKLSFSAAIDMSFSNLRRSLNSEISSAIRTQNRSNYNIDVDSFCESLNSELTTALSFNISQTEASQRPLIVSINSAIDREIKPMTQSLSISHERMKEIKKNNQDSLKNLLNQIAIVQHTFKIYSEGIVRELEREQINESTQKELEASSLKEKAIRLKQLKLSRIELESKLTQQNTAQEGIKSSLSQLKLQRSNLKKSEKKRNDINYQKVMRKLKDIQNDIEDSDFNMINDEIDNILALLSEDGTKMRNDIVDMDVYNRRLYLSKVQEQYYSYIPQFLSSPRRSNFKNFRNDVNQTIDNIRKKREKLMERSFV